MAGNKRKKKKQQQQQLGIGNVFCIEFLIRQAEILRRSTPRILVIAGIQMLPQGSRGEAVMGGTGLQARSHSPVIIYRNYL